MDNMLKILMIGAHPDDCDFRCGGIAIKYARKGHSVTFLSVTDGSSGHHEMKPAELAERRRNEAKKAASTAGIRYDVWDNRDGELLPGLENRRRLIRYIREIKPDLIITHRLGDYHPDHRATSVLVQDASYMLIVPSICPEAEALKEMPVIMHCYDGFTNPRFEPDVVVGIDDVIEKKFEMLSCHESQMYEWLPYTYGRLSEVPEERAERLAWLHEPRIPEGGMDADEAVINTVVKGPSSEYREAFPASKYRKNLIERYGENGKRIKFAEAFSVSEYGSPLTKEKEKELFPF